MDVAESEIVAKLTVIVQNKAIANLNIRKGASVVIGRGNDVHYQIKSGALSRRHCQLIDNGNSLDLLDLDSLNGTFLNRKKVKHSPVKTGDEIQLGPVVLKVTSFYDNAQTGNESASSLFMEPIAKSAPGMAVPPVPQVPQQVASAPIAAVPAAPAVSAAPAPVAKKNAAAIPSYIKRPIFENEFPSGQCLQCGKSLTSKDMASHNGIFKGDKIICLPCFCDGAGNFPTIAGYRIVKKLGGGGMGDVYEAIQLSMERPVAFKLMKGLENASEPQIRRFFREARTGGKLNHPNIVGFIDAGKLEGACFIAMEFIYGIDVRQIIDEKGPIPYQEAFRIAYYVAMALDYASSRFNIVHRDIKPENILIDRDNMIKLTDFGLAKNLEEAGLSGITKSQTGVGTLFYMAPEQIADARFADQRADIYSLGISLYEMMTATRPFVADQMMALVNKIRYEQPTPMTDLVPGIPPKVCTIINKAMEKDPDKRFQSAKQIMEILRPFLSKVSQPR